MVLILSKTSRNQNCRNPAADPATATATAADPATATATAADPATATAADPQLQLQLQLLNRCAEIFRPITRNRAIDLIGIEPILIILTDVNRTCLRVQYCPPIGCDVI
jgi:pyruvate/2-oxoglutarate dehydrogenase complex dihydrolipoamide acyltransferase (E2) component